MKLQVYILRQLLVSFAFGVGGLLFVALPGIAVTTVHRLPNADTLILLRYIPLVLQTLAPYVLPICFLLAVVATYGRLASDREWTAIQMAGIQPLKMLVPPFVVAVVLGGVNYWMVSYELPKLKVRQRAVMHDAVTSSVTNLAPGRTSIQLGEFYLKGAWRDRETGTFHRVYIRQPPRQGVEQFDIFADTANLRVVNDVLVAHLTGVQPVSPEDGRVGFAEKLKIEHPIAEHLGAEPEPSMRPRYHTNPQIYAAMKEEGLKPRYLQRFRFELHYRVAMSMSFLLFLGLGVPTGLLLRRGTQLAALAISSGYGIVYYLLNMRLGKELGMSGVIHPAVGAWVATWFGGVIALFLLWKALRR